MDDRLVGIVGPNGSGKSNVVDALRWVLGERRAEQLRGDGAQQLIFAGNEKRGRGSLTRVTAVFRNDDGTFPVESAEVALERRVTRDGVSQLTLNGREVKLGDVEEFLARARLGPRSFAIVGQGDADLFVRATPAERRMMIEELLGLNEFRLKKKRAARRLKRAGSNMEQVAAQLSELEPHLVFLRREVRKWERRDAVKERLSALSSAYFGNLAEALRRERETGERTVAERDKAKRAAEERVQSLVEAVARAEAALDAGAPRKSSVGDIKKAVREFVSEMKRALRGDATSLSSRVAAWVAKFEALIAVPGAPKTAPLDAFKQAVAALEDARQGVRELERGAEEARFGLERVRLKEDELAREAASVDFDLARARATDEPFDTEEARANIRRMLSQLAAVGEIDEELLAEAKEAEERYGFLSRELADLQTSSEHLSTLIKDLDVRLHGDFRKAFQHINTSFNAYFKRMFGGGGARLSLVGEGDGEEVQGVALELTMPGKRLHSADALSGGERSLVSLAALFALISISPPPFLVMDEIDAALDESNAVRFAELIGQFSESAQFIVVTHNRITIESLNVLYGVTMGDDGVSKVLSLKLS